MSTTSKTPTALDVPAGSGNALVEKLEAMGYRVVIAEDVVMPVKPALDAFVLTAPKKCPEPPLSQPKEWWRGGRPR